MKKYFHINNLKLPVDKKKYLLDILSPTSKGTQYYEPIPNTKISEVQIGRVLLQCHQVVSFLKSLDIDLKNKTMIDIGTGNGLVPKILLKITQLKAAVGTDPFLDGEHKTSWQKHDRSHASLMIDKILKRSKYKLDINLYKKKLKFENFSFHPLPLKVGNNKGNKNYKFIQIDARKLKSITKKFDFVYCKAIEHIGNWENVIKNINSISKKGTIVYFKHRSFFSYLGPHRYSSTFIPWGHLLLNDKQMISYANSFHKDRKKNFLDFYFNGLAYPRVTVNELLVICQKYGFTPKGIQIDRPKYSSKTFKFISDIKDFWKIVWKNYPRVSSEEVFSGIYHIILEKNK
tara:strand:+ start:422 stop:1456 length:1035 start_codon:yes stop_codon:yes gene_type:complete